MTVSAQSKKALLKELRYFEKNALHMRYAKSRERNYFVGSGVVETGCPTVIDQRLKQSDRRWSVRGANAIIALRSCILSGRFEDFWASCVVVPLLSRALHDLLPRTAGGANGSHQRPIYYS